MDKKGPNWFTDQPSACNKKLHPPLDPKDTYDPTFLGTTRKKKVPGPESKIFRPDRGKKLTPIVDQRGEHGFGITRQDIMCIPLNTKSDNTQTRFQKGFVRRKQAQMGIGVSLQSMNDDPEIVRGRESQAMLRATSLAEHSNRNGFNPVTNTRPICGAAIDMQQERASKRTVGTISTMVTVGRDMEHEKAVHDFRRGERKDKIVREGLTGTTQPGGTVREWSVKQQMQCMDGF